MVSCVGDVLISDTSSRKASTSISTKYRLAVRSGSWALLTSALGRGTPNRIPKLLRILKNFPARVAEAVAAEDIAATSRVEIWFQDEMRVGQKNGLVYQWAAKGTRHRHAASSGRDQPPRCSRRPRRSRARQGRLAHNPQAAGSGKHQPLAPAACKPRTQPH